MAELAKVFKLATEMAVNNQKIAEQIAKQKGIKDAVKAYQERNEAIVDEMAVHTEDEIATQNEMDGM